MSNQSDQKTGKITTLTESEKLFNELFTNATSQRGQSCFWDATNTSTGDAWEDHWDLLDKFAIMYWGNMNQDEGFRSNVKSPEIAGRLQSTLQKAYRVNLEFVVTPKRPEAKFLADVTQAYINNEFKKSNVKFRIRELIYNAIRNGSAPATVDFLVRTRKVKIPIGQAKYMTEEGKKKFEEKEEMEYVDVTMVDYRNVVITVRRVQEVYVDPSARHIHIEPHNADYYFLSYLLPYKKFKKIYGEKKGYKNIDKIKPIGEMMVEEDSWFKPPKDSNGDYVHIVEGRFFSDDNYMIRANAQFIKECPLPNRDKKLNLWMFTPFKLPEQLYGIALGDWLIPIVSMLELIQNSVNDNAIYTSNPAMMVESSIYNEFSRHYKKMRPGLLLPVKDVTRAAAPLKFAPLSMDVFQAVQSLQRDAIIASQVDPSQLGVVQKNATATANLLNKEIVDMYVNFVIENSIENFNGMAKQMTHLIYQHLTEEDIYERLTPEYKVEEVSEYRKIPFKDSKVEVDVQNGIFKVTEAPNYTGYLEMSPELLKAKNDKGEEVYVSADDLEIELSTESVEVFSRAMRNQEANEQLAQFSPYMVDPSDRQKVSRHPMPLIDATTFMEEVFEKKGINKRHLINRSEEVRKDIAEAMEQNKAMFNLERPLPEAGMSELHLRAHEDFLKTLVEMVRNLEKITMGMQQPGQVMMPVPGLQDPEKIAQLNRMKEVVSIVREHLEIDSQPAYTKIDQTLNQAAQVTAPSPQAGTQGGATMMGGMGNMGGGTPPLPNLPNQMGYTEGGAGQLGGMVPFVNQ